MSAHPPYKKVCVPYSSAIDAKTLQEIKLTKEEWKLSAELIERVLRERIKDKNFGHRFMKNCASVLLIHKGTKKKIGTYAAFSDTALGHSELLALKRACKDIPGVDENEAGKKLQDFLWENRLRLKDYDIIFFTERAPCIYLRQQDTIPCDTFLSKLSEDCLQGNITAYYAIPDNLRLSFGANYDDAESLTLSLLLPKALKAHKMRQPLPKISRCIRGKVNFGVGATVSSPDSVNFCEDPHLYIQEQTREPPPCQMIRPEDVIKKSGIRLNADIPPVTRTVSEDYPLIITLYGNQLAIKNLGVGGENKRKAEQQEEEGKKEQEEQESREKPRRKKDKHPRREKLIVLIKEALESIETGRKPSEKADFVRLAQQIDEGLKNNSASVEEVLDNVFENIKDEVIPSAFKSYLSDNGNYKQFKSALAPKIHSALKGEVKEDREVGQQQPEAPLSAPPRVPFIMFGRSRYEQNSASLQQLAEASLPSSSARGVNQPSKRSESLSSSLPKQDDEPSKKGEVPKK